MKKIIILSLLFGLSANTAFAQVGTTLDGAAEVTGDAEAAIEVINEVNVDSETGINVGGGTSIESDNSATVETNASAEANSQTETDSGSETTSTTETKSNASVSGISFSVKASGNVDTSIKSSAQVSNETELQSYASVVVNESETVEEVEAEQNELTVTYKSKVKLFGFIPLTIKNRAEVTLNENTNGSVESQVKVKMPWYRFLLKAETKAQDTEAEIKSKIDSAVSAHATVDAQAHAKALGVVETTVKANAAANVN